MPPHEDHQRLFLKLAQFKLLSKDEKFVGKKDIEFVLQGLNLNTKVPGTSYLEKYDDDKIIGDSLLHLAFKEKNLDLYNILLCKGADFNVKDKEGNTVLHIAFHDFCLCYDDLLKWNLVLTSANEKFIVPTLSALVKYRNTSNPPDSNGLTHFHIACAKNDAEAVELFLYNGVQVNEALQCVSSREYFRGYTPLHLAAEFGCIQVTEILLKHGANTNLENDEGQIPLHIAVKRNIEMIDSELHRDVEINERVINLLLNHNARSKFPNLFAISVLKDSCKAKSHLAHEIDVNQTISMDSQIWPGYTALHFAAHVNIDTVKLLIRHGASVEAKEANGITPFDMCVDRYKVEDILDIIHLVPNWKDIILSDGKTKLVDFLGAFKNVDEISSFLQKSKDNLKLFVPYDSPLWPGFTVLHVAVLLTERENCKTDYEREENGTKKNFDPDLTIITECLKQDTDVTVKDRRNWTPVHLAFRLEKQETLALLLQHHHRIQNSTDESNLSHLHIACEDGNKDLVKKLLWNDADVNIVYQGDSPVSCVYPGWTPLHIAIHKTHSEIVKLLLQFGADIYIPDAHGYTAVHRLMRCTDEPQRLGQIVFDVTNLRDFVIEDVGLSYLHVACAVNNVDAVKRLLDLGADVNKVIVCKEGDGKSYPWVLYPNYDGSTPLHLAFEDGDSSRLEVVSLLIERGADLLAKNKSNAFPLSEILECRSYQYLNVVTEALKRNTDLQKRFETETGVTMLHVACCKADGDLVRELLDSGANVNAQIHENSTLWPKSTGLHLLLHGDEDLTGDDDDVNDMIEMLLDHNADVTLTNGRGDTPLHVIFRILCIDQGSSELDNIILLLKAHKDFEVNPTGVEGLSHFHIACHVLEVGVVENFLEHGVDVNMKIDAFCDTSIAASTPLHLAVKAARNLLETDATNSHLKFAQLKIVDLLIKHGAEVNVEDVFGDSPAHDTVSCKFSKESLLQRLANGGANVDAHNVRGEAPLEVLLNHDTVTLNEVRSFITFGCRFNAFNKVTQKGYIALADEVLSHSDMLHLLFGVFVNSPDSMKLDVLKRTAIHNVVSTDKPKTSQAKYVELFDIFMTYGCDIDDQDDLGRTALHLAAQFRNEPAVEGLLAAGADINLTDRDGKTPFAYVFEPCSRCSNRKDEGHDQYSHPGLFKTFMGQIKKMEFCDIYVNPSNEVLLNKALERFDSDSFANDLNDILVEVEQIANLKIESYALSAADFVSAAVAVIDYPMMSLAKRKAISQFFRTNKGQFQIKFKQTAGILQLQYRQALLRKKIINAAVESLRVLGRCRLPDICSHIVLKSLKNFELQNLIASAIENGVTSRMDVDS